MKNPGYVLILSFLLCMATGCKQEATSSNKTNAETETPKVPQPEPVTDEASKMKITLQGRWKSIQEAGVVYEIKGDELQRFFQNKGEPKVHLSFSTACATSCGTVSKQFDKTGTVGCLTLSSSKEECFWVISYAQDQFDFVRIGSPDAKPESWIKM